MNKKEQFKEILLNIKSKNIEYEEYSFFDNLIETLNECEVYILAILYRGGCFENKIKDRILMDPPGFPYPLEHIRFNDQNLLEVLNYITDWSEGDIISTIEGLQDKRLLKNDSSIFYGNDKRRGANLLINCLSEKGKDFCEYLLKD